MTQLLEEAFAAASSLPAAEQDKLADWLLGELKSDERWAQAFLKSEDALQRLANEALQEHREGKTETLDLERL